LVLPANSRLIGEVVQAKPAGKFHHNGELRLILSVLKLPTTLSRRWLKFGHARREKKARKCSFTLARKRWSATSKDRKANMKLDDEGGARTTDSKTHYLSTGLAVLLAAAAAHPDVEHGARMLAATPECEPRRVAPGFDWPARCWALRQNPRRFRLGLAFTVPRLPSIRTSCRAGMTLCCRKTHLSKLGSGRRTRRAEKRHSDEFVVQAFG
jgi:hypothetical protein